MTLTFEAVWHHSSGRHKAEAGCAGHVNFYHNSSQPSQMICQLLISCQSFWILYVISFLDLIVITYSNYDMFTNMIFQNIFKRSTYSMSFHYQWVWDHKTSTYLTQTNNEIGVMGVSKWKSWNKYRVPIYYHLDDNLSVFCNIS